MPKSNSANPDSVTSDEVNPPLATPSVSDPPTPRENRIVWAIIALTMALTSLPFLYAMYLNFPDHQFVGQVYNVDDYCVYSSWVNQVAHGSFYLRNLFTTEPQLGKQINIYFLLLGNIVRFTHIPLPWVMALIRFFGGIALLRLVYRFYVSMLSGSATARLIAFTLTSLGTGFGWVFAGRWWNVNNFHLPVDTWQPEAFPILSLDTSALFVVGMLMIVSTIWLLLIGERTRQARYGIYAGLCGLVIGNIHSYDILHVVAAWGLFLVVRDVAARRFRPDSWGRALIAAVLTMPSVAYQFWLFKADPVFHARAADTFTKSQGPMTYILGYGVTLLLAIVAVALTLRSKRYTQLWQDREAMLLPICWVIATFVIVYLPSAFQRKMIMGVDFPLCLLAGAAVVATTSSMPRVGRLATIGAVLALSIPTGLLFIARDLRHAAQNESETNSPPFLYPAETDLFRWISANTSPADTILGPPPLMIYVPGFCNRTVWCGHWSETEMYAAKLESFGYFTSPRASDDWRRGFLYNTHARYLVAIKDSNRFPTDGPPPPYLVQVHENDGYVVYEIHPGRGIVAAAPIINHLLKTSL